ncbi:MAG: 1-deoxy-D-xylulose-5-phosphate synthase, partial [Gemmatimonadota bacterium]|nr:1-deoxy-D-xylulose-5-phosphate synthase [Gemmatimonadota bacterium]
FGSAVLEALSDEGISHLRKKVIGLPDWYIEQGPQDLLRERYGLTTDGIYTNVKALLGAAVATDEANRMASLIGNLPQGDEQGS